MPVIDNVMITFHQEAVKNETASEEAGRPIYDNIDFIEKQVVGDNKSMINRPVRDEDKMEFADAWNAYIQKSEPTTEPGTPLDRWAPCDPAQVKELEHYNIRTVDQLALVHDGQLQNIGHGYRSLRDQAIGFITTAEGTATPQALTAEITRLKDKVAEQSGTIAQQAAHIRMIEAKLPKEEVPERVAAPPVATLPADMPTNLPKTTTISTNA